MTESNTKGTIFSNFLWQSTLEVSTNILGAIFFFLLARSLASDLLGIYSYLLSLTLFGGVLVNYGPTTYLLRKLTQVKTQTAFSSTVSEFLLLRLVLFLPFSLSMILLSRLDTNLTQYILFTIPIVFLDSLNSLFSTVAQATNTFKISSLAGIIEKLISFGVGSILLLFFHIDIKIILILILLSKGVSFCYYLYKKTFFFNKDSLRIRLLYSNLLTAKSLFFVSISGIIYTRLDSFLIRYYLGLMDVGLYSFAYRFWEVASLVPTILFTASFPILSRLEKLDNKQLLRTTYGVLFSNVRLIILSISVFMLVLLPTLISTFYGNKFANSDTVLSMFAFLFPIMSLTLPASQILLIRYKDNYLLIMNMLLVAINLVSNVTLLPILGITGAAISMYVTEVALVFIALFGLRGVFALKHYIFIPASLCIGLLIPYWSLAKHVGSAVLIFFLCIELITLYRNRKIYFTIFV